MTEFLFPFLWGKTIKLKVFPVNLWKSLHCVYLGFILLFNFRQVGIKNGMFFGQAKKLCPNLQAVSYDFDAYKEVARTVYEILAR